MTLDEAKKIASVVRFADGGCGTCVGHLVDRLNKAFPEFIWSTGEYGEAEGYYYGEPCEGLSDSYFDVVVEPAA